jgi:hypothetical protein
MKDPLQGSFSFWYCLYRVVLAVVFLCCGCCCCHSHTQNFVSCVAPPYVHMSVEWTDLCIFPSTFLNFFFFLLSIKWRHTWFFFLSCFSTAFPFELRGFFLLRVMGILRVVFEGRKMEDYHWIIDTHLFRNRGARAPSFFSSVGADAENLLTARRIWFVGLPPFFCVENLLIFSVFWGGSSAIALVYIHP